MWIRKIEMENFGVYKDFSLVLPKTGLLHIEGKNMDESFEEKNGCLAGETFIDCPRDLIKYPKGIPIKELVGQTPWVYAWKDGSIVVRKASRIWKTKSNTKVIRVRLSTGQLSYLQGSKYKEWYAKREVRAKRRLPLYYPPFELVGTADHLVLLSDGVTWKELGKLEIGDSLCSLYRKAHTHKHRAGNESILRWTGGPKRVREARFIASEIWGLKEDSIHVHHKNHQVLDQPVENLIWLEGSEHLRYHTSKRNRLGLAGWKVSGKHPRGFLGHNHSLESRNRITQTLKKAYAEKVNHSVIAIEDAGEMDVYDMTVPDAHSFIANGVVVHNCGKSTLLDSISFTLYGRTIHEGGKKKLPFKDAIRFNCHSARVALEILDGEEPFVVAREINKTAGKLSVSFSGETLYGQFAQDWLDRKLDLPYEAFLSSCLFGQGMYHIFLASSDDSKMKLFERMFHLNIIEEIQQELKEEITVLGNELVLQSKQQMTKKSKYESQLTKYTLMSELYENKKKEAEYTLTKYNIDVIQEKLDIFNSGVKKEQGKVDNLQLEVNAIQSTINSLHYDFKNVGVKLEIGKPCPTCKNILEEIPENIKTLQERQEKKRQEEASLQERLKQVQEKLKQGKESLTKVTEDYYRLKALQEQAEKEIQTAKEILSLSQEYLIQEKQSLDKVEKEYKEITGVVDEIVSNRESRERLRKLLNDKDLRGRLVNQYLELINHYSHYFVSYLTNGEFSLQFEFQTDKIEVVIARKGQGKVPYLRYSGGERRRIDFGLFLAFHMVNKQVFKNPLSVLLLDEILDSLDSMGIAACTQLLKQELSNLGLVLITSHQESIEDLFDDKISLVKKGGITSLA